MIGDWRKLCNEELHGLYCSPNIVRMFKERRRWAGHVTCRGEKEIHAVFRFENGKERGYYDDLGVGGRIIFSWLGNKCWAFANMLMKLLVL
jgi:hypothetical protein